jgi:excisionase family DNA binding protein
MNMTKNRLDPSLLTPAELDRLTALVNAEERPALIGREGIRIDLPSPIFHLLVDIVSQMQQGRAIVMLPEDETFTTQAAADFLGVSRQFLVNQLEKGEIPHHRVGSHRRVTLKDLLTYQKNRDKTRRETLKVLFHKLKKTGHYDED